MISLKKTNKRLKLTSTEVRNVSSKIHDTGMKVNASKSKFFEEVLQYLGNQITRQGIQPIHNKIESIRNVKALKL